jgi:drug/metabolite transporter (DMT)-like permease
MNTITGIALAFTAMLGWGIGDFMVQQNTRKLGDTETLFILSGFGTIVLLPFVFREIPGLVMGSSTTGLWILLACGILLLVATLMNFQAFKIGKISVLEPLYSIEIIAAALMAYLILNDVITWIDAGLIAILVVCLFMISFRSGKLSHRIFMEKGVILFAVGAFVLGFADFLLGWGSRVVDPILATWVVNAVIAVSVGMYLLLEDKIPQMIRDIRGSGGSLLIMAICENIAWVAYAVAMSLVPIAIATGLSESSIIIAVLLGIMVGKERLQRHQKIGLVGAIVATIVLAAATAG